MTTATRRGPGRPRDEAADAAILEAAIDELADKGFHAASIEGIAARAGVAKTTIYRRWPGSDGLFLDALRSRFHSDNPEPPDGSVRDQLLALLEGMRRNWSDPRYAAIMRRVAADGTNKPEVYRHCRDQLIAPHIAALHRVLRRGQDEGLIRDDVDVEFARTLFTSPIIAAAMTLRPRVTRHQVEVIVDTVLAGLRPGHDASAQ